MKHKLDLLENARDSLDEALRQYRGAEVDTPRTYKFAILLFAHSIELYLKHIVSQHHELLLFRNPFSKKIASGTETTINLWDAVQFLKNTGYSFDRGFLSDLEWIKKLRNDIEHYRFTMDVHEVRATISRLFRAFELMGRDFSSEELRQSLSPESADYFAQLISEEHVKLMEAQKNAHASGHDRVSNCLLCNAKNSAVFTREKHDTRMQCFFCGESQRIFTCEACGCAYPERDMVLYTEIRYFYGTPIAAACVSCDYYVEQ